MLFLRLCTPTLYPSLLYAERHKHVGCLFLIHFATPFAEVCVSLTVSERYMGLMLWLPMGGPVPSCAPSFISLHPHPAVQHPVPCCILPGRCSSWCRHHQYFILRGTPACYCSLYKRYGCGPREAAWSIAKLLVQPDKLQRSPCPSAESVP